MATYKVIQDIEAEDKLLGPLTLRQFIFAIITVLFLYFCYLSISKHVTFLLVIFIPPALFTGFFAFPFGKDQPTEIWALAKLRFLFKPRRRIWDQSGVKELVTITVPKKIIEMRTNGLSQHEVKSRLSTLANTIDSRGWSVKNVNASVYSQPGFGTQANSDSDRLVEMSNAPQEVIDVQAADDILDAQNNPIAHQFDEMINASTQAHRQQIMAMMNQASAPAAPVAQPQAMAIPAAPLSKAQTQQQVGNPVPTPAADYWFLNQPVEPPKLKQDQAMFSTPQVVSAGTDAPQPGIVQAAEPTAAEEALGEQFKQQHSQPDASYAHLKTIQPLGIQPPQPAPAPLPPTPINQPAAVQQTPVAAPLSPVTPPPNPAILELANNNDLNVATIARQAHKAADDTFGEDEVVIALH
jgi:hypothetical protein